MVKLNIRKRYLYSFALVFGILLGLGIVLSYQEIIPNPGHGGGEVWVSVNDAEMTLQEAIDGGYFDYRELPGDGVGLTPISAISFTGYGSASCIITDTSSKAVSCSGYNAHGELGVGDTTRRLTFKANNIEDAIKIASGNFYNCALLADGAVQCWGYNSYGQIGSGDTTTKKIPTPVVGLSDVSDIQLNRDYYKPSDTTYWPEFACALKNNGDVYCWGYGYHYQMGNGSNYKTNSKPVKVMTSNVKVLRVGGHGAGGWACGISGNLGAVDNDVYCWGYGGYGQMGNADNYDNPTPHEPVSNLFYSKSLALTPSDYGTGCAITGLPGTPEGNVKCWGYNGRGQLGIGTTTPTSWGVAQDVNGLKGDGDPGCGDDCLATKLVTSGSGTRTSICALTASKKVKCWGDNYRGRIGLPKVSTDYYTAATLLKDSSGNVIENVKDIKIAAWGDYGFGCLLTEDGNVKCFGYNGYGQLGTGDTTNSFVAKDVHGINGEAKAIFLGGAYGSGQKACAILNPDNRIKCWGFNGNGELGTDDQINYKVPTSPV